MIDSRAPSAIVQFPPDGCLTDEERITLTVAASDDNEVAAVEVANESAVLGPDGRWTVTVSLGLGFNLFRVTTRDELGNRNAFATTVGIQRHTTLWIDPAELVLDAASGDAVVLDPTMRAILRVQPDGSRQVISGAGTGRGPALEEPSDLELLGLWGAVLTTDRLQRSLVSVDLASGARTVLSGPAVGDGPALVEPRGIALDLRRNRALVIDPGRAELTAVHLATGQRSAVSGESIGGGPALGSAWRVALDARRDRALVTVPSRQLILAVDLASGARIGFSGRTIGTGPLLVAPADLAVDLAQDRVFVTDPGARAVFEIDLADGARRILPGSATPGDPDWIAPTGVAVGLGGTLLVTDNALDALNEIGRGRRRVVSGITTGPGPVLAEAVTLDFSPLSDLVVVGSRAELTTVGVSDGARRMLSGPGQGQGGWFEQVGEVALSRGPRACITVLDFGIPGLIAVDPFNGDQSLLGAQGLGLSRPRCMVLEPSVVDCSNAALVVDQPADSPASIVRVDLRSGNRSLVTGPSRGSGPDIVDPVAIEVVLQPLDAFLVVLDAEQRALLQVDLFTGERGLAPLPPLPGTPTDFLLDEEGLLVTAADPPGLHEVRGNRARLLSGADAGSGPALGRPTSLALVPSRTVGTVLPLETAYVVDRARGAVLAIDRRTGQRVIRSK